MKRNGVCRILFMCGLFSMFGFKLVRRFLNHHEEERSQNDTDGYGNSHSEEYTGTDGLTAGCTRPTTDYHRDHTQDEGQ